MARAWRVADDDVTSRSSTALLRAYCGSCCRDVRTLRNAALMRRLALHTAQRLRASSALAPQPHRAFIKLPASLASEKTFNKRKTVPYSPQQARSWWAFGAAPWRDRAAHARRSLTWWPT